mgnify:CR=1 FL=1
MMTPPSNCIYAFLPSGQEQAAAELVEQTFMAQVAPHYPPEGVQEFMSYVSAQAISGRLAANNFMLAASSQDKLIGIVEADSSRGHIVWFFVEQEKQGRGVGRKLLAGALAELKKRNPDISEVTVNSSPNSVDIYSALGFAATGQQQERNGISFTPMAVSLA